MNWLNTLLLLALAFFGVFLESAFNAPRLLLGAQIDLLPAFAVYAALSGGLPMLALLAVCGGLWHDSLSANPLGVSVMPLFIVGLFVFSSRSIVLRELNYARFILGFMASAATPVLTLLLLLTIGKEPLLGWESLWQWLVMSVGGAIAAPLCFILLDRLTAAFSYPISSMGSFRPDREIKRGRS